MLYRILSACLLALAVSPTVFADSTDELIALYAQQPAMTRPVLSPKGDQVAYIGSHGGRNHLVIERFRPEFERHIVAPGPEYDFEWVRWGNENRLIFSASASSARGVTETRESRLFSANAKGEDLEHIIRPASIEATGTNRVVRDAPPQIQDKVIDLLPDEPNHILVAIDEDFDNMDEVRRVDIRNGRYRNVVKDLTVNLSWVTDPDGQVRLGWAWAGDDLQLALKEQGGGLNWPDNYQAISDGFVPVAIVDEDLALATGRDEDGRRIVRKLRLSTGEFVETVFAHDIVDAGGLVYEGRTRKPVGVKYSLHGQAVEYFDPEYQRMQAMLDRAIPSSQNAIVSVSDDLNTVLVFNITANSTGRYLIWDRASNRMSLYSEYLPGLGEGTVVPAAPVEYEARDGWRIPGYLTVPPGAVDKPLPTVLLPHGGPHARDDGGYWFLSQFLVAQGYVVMQPNFRGSSGYGAAFANAGRGEWGGKMQDDLTDAAEWLIAEGIADPERLCIVGWSYGGYAAAMGAVKTPDLFKCVVSINGVLNLPRHIAEDKQYTGGREWTQHMGLDGEKSKTVSPYHQAERIKAPVLIIQAEDDARVHKEQGRMMAKKLKSLGKDCEYIEIEFGGHSVRNVEGRRTILGAVDSFLEASIQ